MFTLLRQRRLCWPGHVYPMGDGRIPKDILYGELASGRRTKGRPQLRYKDVCKRDMKALDINTESPGPYCFHFSSGATIPNPAGPHVADRGTNPRYECDGVVEEVKVQAGR